MSELVTYRALILFGGERIEIAICLADSKFRNRLVDYTASPASSAQTLYYEKVLVGSVLLVNVLGRYGRGRQVNFAKFLKFGSMLLFEARQLYN